MWSSEQAESEPQRTHAERQGAKAERQRADDATGQLEAERQRAELLAAKLRELGIDPEAP